MKQILALLLASVAVVGLNGCSGGGGAGGGNTNSNPPALQAPDGFVQSPVPASSQPVSAQWGQIQPLVSNPITNDPLVNPIYPTPYVSGQPGASNYWTGYLSVQAVNGAPATNNAVNTTGNVQGWVTTYRVNASSGSLINAVSILHGGIDSSLYLDVSGPNVIVADAPFPPINPVFVIGWVRLQGQLHTLSNGHLAGMVHTSDNLALVPFEVVPK